MDSILEVESIWIKPSFLRLDCNALLSKPPNNPPKTLQPHYLSLPCSLKISNRFPTKILIFHICYPLLLTYTKTRKQLRYLLQIFICNLIMTNGINIALFQSFYPEIIASRAWGVKRRPYAFFALRYMPNPYLSNQYEQVSQNDLAFRSLVEYISIFWEIVLYILIQISDELPIHCDAK